MFLRQIRFYKQLQFIQAVFDFNEVHTETWFAQHKFMPEIGFDSSLKW